MTRLKLLFTDGETLTLLVALPTQAPQYLTSAGRLFEYYYTEPTTHASVGGQCVENGPHLAYRERDVVALEALMFKNGA